MARVGKHDLRASRSLANCLWAADGLQALADILGREVRVPHAPSHVPAIGAAALAAAALTGGTGLTAPASPPPAVTSFPPNHDLHNSTYATAFARFCKVHPALKDTFAAAIC